LKKLAGYGKYSRKRISPRTEKPSNVSGFLRSRETEFFKHNWLLLDIVRFLELTSIKVLLLLSIILVSESC
jgi:hypothetical protein